MIEEEVIVKAVGALLSGSHQTCVLTFDQFKKETEKNPHFDARKVDYGAFHRVSSSWVSGLIGDRESASLERNMQIFLKTTGKTGKTIEINCNSATTIGQLKIQVQELEGVRIEQQQLIFAGQPLEDEITVGDYKMVHRKSTVFMILRLGCRVFCGASPFYTPKELFYPQYDSDLTGVIDDTELYTRGPFAYKRPCGWNRIALNVLGKYGNDDWIGAHLERTTATSSVDDEWPVSYFGAGKHNSRSIAEDGYLMSRGKRFANSSGFYSTPDIELAEKYSQKFTLGEKQYSFLMQNRVNPKTLIRITPNSACVAGGEFWVTPIQDDIRPYGICIKQIN